MNIYNQLLDILHSAIFGAETVLTSSQSFVLEQVCVWMSLLVVLAPIVAMCALTIKLLKW